MKFNSYSAARASDEVSERALLVADAFFESRIESMDVPIFSNLEVPCEGVTFITGESGSGKSSLLQLIEERYPKSCGLANIPLDQFLVDSVGSSLEEAISALSYVGLSDAFALMTKFGNLSDGQKFRARLARTLSNGPTVIIIDEFLSNVDRTTAKMVAFNFQRVCRDRGITAFLASAHDDLRQALMADCVIELSCGGESSHFFGDRLSADAWGSRVPVEIGPGSTADYWKLSKYHYRSDIGTGEDIFDYHAISAKFQGRLVGVRLHRAPYPREWEVHSNIFRCLNESLTLGHRLVIHPSFRGAGLSRSLCDVSLSPRSTIYIRSAMSFYTHLHERLGFSRVDPVSNNTIGHIPSSMDEKRVVAVVMLVRECLQFLEISGECGIPTRDDIQFLASWFSSGVARLTDEQVTVSLNATRMAGYVGKR
jgi:ABC-type lipoprotein export system ATPase subunit